MSLFNPVVYLISGLRWAFYGAAHMNHCREYRHDARLPGRQPDGGVVGVQDRMVDPALSLHA